MVIWEDLPTGGGKGGGMTFRNYAHSSVVEMQ